MPVSGAFVERYARFALGAAFLSAVAGRFGLWTGAPWGEAFARFLVYTGEVNSFMPAAPSRGSRGRPRQPK